MFSPTNDINTGFGLESGLCSEQS